MKYDVRESKAILNERIFVIDPTCNNLEAGRYTNVALMYSKSSRLKYLL